MKRKITEKVAFNVSSEASYVYILSGQSKKNKNGQFGEFLKINSVTRQVSFNRTKIPQFKDSNARFRVIFKQYENIP